MPKISIRAKIKNNHGPKVINVPEMHIDTNSKLPAPEGSRATGHGSGYGSGSSYGGDSSYGSSSYESSPSYGGGSGYESSSSYGSSSASSYGSSPSSYSDQPSGSYSAGASSYGSAPAASSYPMPSAPAYSAPSGLSGYEAQSSYGSQSNYGAQNHGPQPSYGAQAGSQEYSSHGPSYGSSGSAYGNSESGPATYNEAPPSPSYVPSSSYGASAPAGPSYQPQTSMIHNTRNQYGSSGSSYSQQAASSAYPPMATKYGASNQQSYQASPQPASYIPQQTYQSGPTRHPAAPQMNSYSEAAALTSGYNAGPPAESYPTLSSASGYGGAMESNYAGPQSGYGPSQPSNAYTAASSKSYQTASASNYNQASAYAPAEQSYSPPRPYYESGPAYGQHIGHEPIGYQPLEPGHTLLSASNDNYDGLSTISVASNPPKDYGYKSAHGASNSYNQAPAYQPKPSQNSYSQPQHAYQPSLPSSYGASQPQFDDNAATYATMNQGNYGIRASSSRVAEAY